MSVNQIFARRPTPDAVQKVIHECGGIEEPRAIALLKMHQNNPDEAIKFYNESVDIFHDIRPPTPSSEPLHGENVLLATPFSLAQTPEPSFPVPQFENPTPESIEPDLDPVDIIPDDITPEPECTDEPEWDFILPRVPAPLELKTGGDGGFSLHDLVGAMQSGASYTTITSYIEYYDRRVVSKRINDSVDGFPAMFYAVGTNNEWIVRGLANYGGDVNAVHEKSGVPLLAFAIINSDNIQHETSLMVATLLSLGSKAAAIPSAFYIPFCEDLPEDGFADDETSDKDGRERLWCTPTARAKIARTLNLTQRYYLEKSVKTKAASVRHKQVALRRNAAALLGIHYFLIGQTTAATSLMQKLLSYMTLPSKRPLVLVFAGPSGHGKTELARRLGYLLSLELEVIDCTIYNHEADLFGHRHPFVGAERGTPVNNFLARKSGQRCIVFLDEFEKTTADVHKALLIPFDQGEYQDRRNLNTMDCSKTIWILATNALDPTIMEFCKQNDKALFLDDDASSQQSLIKSLGKQLRNEFKDQFKPPLTGRISSFLPFLPFSLREQAVVAHKYVMELAQRVRPPISLSFGPDEQLLGNVYLRVRRDASVCKTLAEEGYDQDLGARSLITAVRGGVEEVLVEAYLDVDEEIYENQAQTEFVVDIRAGDVEVKMIPQDAGSGLSESEGSESDNK